MKLSEYFGSAKGIGVLGTANAAGEVDAALYARPHFIDEQTVAFIMADRLSHRNLQSNPQAAYLFVEHGPGYKGHRLYLTKVKEDADPDLIASMRRRSRIEPQEPSPRYLVHFRINQVRPLVGEETSNV